MTSIKELSKQINIDPREIYRIIKRDNLIIEEQNRPRIYLTEKQCDYITRIFFFDGKCNFIILESKMNIQEKKETFKDFKLRVYGEKS